MATYSVSCDEVFIRCTDVGVVELYELDNLYFAPVKHKHWSHLGTLHMGVGKQYESLRIGNKTIKGAHLDAAMHDLFDSRLMVNREGLCFYPAADGIDHSDGGSLRIEYYRIFDRFNWGKYGVKAQLLSTKWGCTDVLHGRPLVLHFSDDNDDEGDSSDDREMYKQKLIEKEKELQDEKRARKELEEMVQNKENELVKKNEEISKLQKKNEADVSSSTALQIMSSYHRNTQNVKMYFSNLAHSFRADFPASKVVVALTTARFNRGFPHNDTYEIPIMVPVKSADSVSTLGNINLAITSTTWIKFDTDGWRVLKVATLDGGRSHPPMGMQEFTVVYYDGKFGEIQAYGCKATIPIPTSTADFGLYHNPMTYYIAGIGPRLLSFPS